MDNFSSVINSDIKCVLLNVGGLKTKLIGPDFEDFIVNYDVVFLTESKLSVKDDIHFSNHTMVTKCRKRCARASGGLAVLFKNEFFNKFEVIPSPCEFVLWIKLKSITVNVIFGLVYIPPCSSKYSESSMFDELELDTFNVSSRTGCQVILMGDFNARTGTQSDCFYYSTDVCNSDNLPVDFVDELLSEKTLQDVGISPTRHSEDTTTNQYGTNLINMCKSLNLYIVNGRVGGDAGIGRVTCKDASLVDYVLAKPDLFKSLSNFNVHHFDSMLSDAHNAIHFSLAVKTHSNPVSCQKKQATNVIENSNSCIKAPIRPKWSPDCADPFKNNICQNDVDQVCLQLTNLSKSRNLTSEEVNDIVADICSIFKDSAAKLGILANSKTYTRPRKVRQKRQQPCKPWFTSDCENKRLLYYIAKNRFNRSKNSINRTKVKSASKAYKKELKAAHNVYTNNLHKKLRNLKSTNSKEYWKLINNKGKKDRMDDIPLKVFLDHFKKLHSSPEEDSITVNCEVNPSQNSNIDNSFINQPFTEEEIKKVVSKLKNDKACGFDSVINEYIKSTIDMFLPLYTKLFNVILDTGIIPSDWGVGLINPLYKNKGPKENPDNYRGITILSCFGKLFTALVNARLEQFLHINGLLGMEQAGFRKGHSTVDHIFALHSLIDLYTSAGKRLHCCFVDYRKAFDSVDRVELWKKLINNNVTGKIFNVIRNIYKHAKSCVKVGNNLSDFFFCNVGVRQGENLSPLLFAIFLNDLNEFLSTRYSGLEFFNSCLEESRESKLLVFIKLYTLLYADDTILFSESADQLQLALNGLYDYCKLFKLDVNLDKTKIVIFSKGLVRKYPEFHFNGNSVEVCREYTYLGVVFNFNGKFTKAKTYNCNQASRAMYALINKSNKMSLPIDIQLQLFDALVLPVLTYGCEVWGVENLDVIEKFHLKYLKIILHVNKSTCSNMVYGELGRLPVTIHIKSRILSFWGKLLKCNEPKVSTIMLKLMSHRLKKGMQTPRWLSKVKQLLNDSGLCHMWSSQLSKTSIPLLKKQFVTVQKNQFLQLWLNQIWNSGKCTNYRIFKDKFVIEPYLTFLPKHHRIMVTKFRCRNHKLPVETGAYLCLERSKRVCTLCISGEIGDEFHYLFKCKHFSRKRAECIKNYYTHRPNTIKYYDLFNHSTKKQLIGLAKFIITIMKSPDMQ